MEKHEEVTETSPDDPCPSFSTSSGCKKSAQNDTRFGKRQLSIQHSFQNKRKKYDFNLRLKEVDVGITEYIINHDGFLGTIKERYSDFHVHEMSLDGQIATLTNQEIPPELKELEDIEQLRNTIPLVVQNQIDSLSDKDLSVSTIEIDVTDWDKVKRRAVHVLVKSIPNAVSQTLTKDARKVITVSKSTYKKDVRVDWSKRGGDYCHFLLHKTNLDTIDALNRISSNLRMKVNCFSYAGTKDRRGKTTQWVSIKKVDPNKILRSVRSIKGLFVGNFKFEASPLKLGMLLGNQFTIVLRNIVDPVEKIQIAMLALKDHGFINYYGLQRFGTIANIPTHNIGRTLLQGNWQEAINLILKPRDSERDKCLAEARQIYKQTGDAIAAYNVLNRTDTIEAQILCALKLHGNHDIQAVLNAIPKNVILMYLHAYQSFVWNNVVSRRFKEYGRNPIAGDLVFQSSNNQEINEITSINKSESLELNCNEDNELTCNLQKVKILKEEDLANYKIEDIVMPQPGWRVTYPTYAVSWYEEFLHEDGLTKDLKQKNKKFTLGGSYRKILQVPLNLSWKLCHYNKKDEDLVISDIDRLKKVEQTKDVIGGKFSALIVKMTLPPSTYATMALREVLKHDTSTQSQAELSAKYNETENLLNESDS
ncbi:pseudouridylate synthase 7 homolog isoform X2 [Leptopilina boulardi]|uniref:pseudouridylate synthase 7 homolog isoform X2 n=1 Tax=Leptopilina boulardi TaxID=63433 RepID=UPI0021F63ABF|nr:pseudouridylate synthase 7 homolog isoform X2 [Leptopilina boulardi]XP_051170991.1 pseudouridylate synthase 7 homolog isoform X2 [Leptopilina boulardi]